MSRRLTVSGRQFRPCSQYCKLFSHKLLLSSFDPIFPIDLDNDTAAVIAVDRSCIVFKIVYDLGLPPFYSISKGRVIVGCLYIIDDLWPNRQRSSKEVYIKLVLGTTAGKCTVVNCCFLFGPTYLFQYSYTVLGFGTIKADK